MNEHIAGEDLAAFVDGRLQAGARAGIESHLSRCRECREALVEIVDIQGSAEKIPGDFLNRALGVNPGPAKALPPMRLVFGIAAVFLAVVVIGYFYLGDRAPAPVALKEQAAAVAEDRRIAAPADGGMARTDMTKSNIPARAGRNIAANGLKKEKTITAPEAEPGRPAPPPTAEAFAPAGLPGKTEQLQLAVEEDGALPREAVGGVVGGVEAPMAKDKEMTLAAVSAASGAQAGELKKNDAEIQRQAAVPGRSKGGAQAAGTPLGSRFSRANASVAATQFFFAVTGRAATPLAVDITDLATSAVVRIAGDVTRADLSDPMVLDSWSWFPSGLVLELDIDAAGAVVAVTPVGPWGERAAARAEAAARELRFSVSEKRSRRASLSLSALPPN